MSFHVSPLIDKQRIHLTRKTLRFQCKQRRKLIRGKLAKEYSLSWDLSKLFWGLINFAGCLSRIGKQKQIVYPEKRTAIKPRLDSSSYWNPGDLNVSTYRSLNQLFFKLRIQSYFLCICRNLLVIHRVYQRQMTASTT